MMDFLLLVKDREKKAISLVRKLTHSGELDLDKQDLKDLRDICKASEDDLTVTVFKKCMKCLHKEHSQVRVSTVKLLDHLFQRSHIVREKLLDSFDTFLELTLAISQKPKVKLKLPPPKKHASLLMELTAKLINSWHADFGCGYEKIRYIYKFLREHRLVDFSHFQVQTQEQLLQRQKLAEKQDKILTRSIENRMKEFRILEPEIEQLIGQIESLLDILIGSFHKDEDFLEPTSLIDDTLLDTNQQRHHGISNLNQKIEIEFSPYLDVQRNQDNKDIVQNLKELKSQLIESKLTKLIGIEKTISKRSEQFLSTLKEIIDLKNKSMNIILKLGELKIINESEGELKNTSTLDNADSGSDVESDFEEVGPKEGLETYIPKSMRSDYGLEPIDPKELNSSGRTVLSEEVTYLQMSELACSSSSLVIPCNVRLESGKLCPRRDKIKCPFHGKIIPRDPKGLPLNEQDRLREEKATKSDVPDWQEPGLLRDIKAATGIDLTMPKRGKAKVLPQKKLINTKTCDLTPKQRLQKRLSKLNK